MCCGLLTLLLTSIGLFTLRKTLLTLIMIMIATGEEGGTDGSTESLRLRESHLARQRCLFEYLRLGSI